MLEVQEQERFDRIYPQDEAREDQRKAEEKAARKLQKQAAKAKEVG